MLSVVCRHNNTLVVLGRVYGISGTLVPPSAVSSIQWYLVHQSDNSYIVPPTTLNKYDCLFSTTQTFTFPDSTTFAYNFKHVISGTLLNEAGIALVASYKFTDNDGYSFYGDVEILIGAET